MDGLTHQGERRASASAGARTTWNIGDLLGTVNTLRSECFLRPARAPPLRRNDRVVGNFRLPNRDSVQDWLHDGERMTTQGTGRGDRGGHTDGADVLKALYQDLHQNPELSFEEHRTAAIGASWLRDAGFTVTTGIGRTGVAGVLERGTGSVVMLRADMDGLPVAEATGLPYASAERGVDRDGNDVPVMHACGHDMHVTCVLGAASALARSTDWTGEEAGTPTALDIIESAASKQRR